VPLDPAHGAGLAGHVPAKRSSGEPRNEKKKPGFSILKARLKKSSLPLLPEKVVTDSFRKPMKGYEKSMSFSPHG
jgi:hypothetical protein